MRSGVALFCASLLLVATPSYANGRFPMANRLLQDPSNPDHLFLAATFGVLASHDRGQDWFHFCETALSPDLVESDPLLELLPSGDLLAALVRPLMISTDCGCSWQPVLGQASTDWVIDIAKAGPNSVIALARSSQPPVQHRMERSMDGGRSWSMVSVLPTGLQAFTLDAAPSNPMRIYVSATLNMNADAGIAGPQPALLVSDDGGTTWVVRPIQGSTSEDQPYIAAVHPENPDAIFVRMDAWVPNDETGLDDAADALFYSDDAGVTAREVIRKGAKLFGFALSPDGSAVLAGYGDPVQATRNAYPEDVGIYRASMTDFMFTQALNAPVSCLTWNGTGLYACIDSAVGFSADGNIPATADGFTSILDFANVRGPLACNAATCLPDWQQGREDVASVCDRLGAVCEIDPAMNVLTCDAPTGGAGGSGTAGASPGGAMPGGSSNQAGMGSAGGGAVPTGGGAGTVPTGGMSGKTPKSTKPSSSCGCRLSSSDAGQGAVMVLLVPLIWLRRRTRYGYSVPQRSRLHASHSPS